MQKITGIHWEDFLAVDEPKRKSEFFTLTRRTFWFGINCIGEDFGISSLFRGLKPGEKQIKISNHRLSW